MSELEGDEGRESISSGEVEEVGETGWT